ncbi:hypothetical protein LEM8419_03190 [Neolewinella maritima]|uniref:DUF5723 domain-containing protein n=1 Tax=Neolewinella maritima TaxID=1383882 RepID=A0ABN8FDP1_9BACT|nr:DUF5723 family protein [Neolewinella maritima]CAH1002271.1 hypothetical protein LEM8419_03190 [Neolewinella maritima]
MNYPTPLLLLCLVLFLGTRVRAQSFPGANLDTYGGMYPVLLNPATLGATRTKASLHLGSVAGQLQNDYLTFRAGKLRPALQNDDFTPAVVTRNDGPAHTMNLGAEVIGPSLLLRLSPRTGMAIFTRARALQSIRGVNGHLVEGLYDGFDQLPDFTVAQSDYSATLHAFGEIGLALGTVLLQAPHHRIKVGGTLKYLQGLGAIHSSGRALAGQYNADRDLLTLDGDITFGRTADFYMNELDPATRTAGVGFDAGMVYEWHPTGAHDPRHPLQYRLRVGVSVTDLGGITYSGQTTEYRIAGSIATADTEPAGDVEELLDDHYPATAEESAEVRIGLPAALHAFADYRMTGQLYLSALYSSSLRADGAANTNSIRSSLTLSPRYEGRWFGLYAPVTFRQDAAATVGLGVRAGILTVGSSSLLSHLVGQGSSAADIFVGIRIPFHGKANKRK